MTLVKVAARDWKVEINTGTEATPTWVEVLGLNTLGFGSGKEDRDTTDFKSVGWAEHLVAQRSRTLTLEGYHLEDPADGTRDPGQDAVDAAGKAVGVASLSQYRLTSPGGNIETFHASSNPAERGGGNNDNTSWGAELTVSGKPTAA
jgi:hypothetical protein